MFTRMAVVVTLMVALVTMENGRVAAHHGWSGYDSNKPLLLIGIIQEAGYEHPHAYLKLEAPGKTWLVVLAPPSRMERRGIPRDMLQVGTTVTVEGYPHRTESNEMRAEQITIGGKTVGLRR